MFTYDMQYGGEPHERVHFRGEINYDGFIAAFENFPWLDEIEKANANPEAVLQRCRPRINRSLDQLHTEIKKLEKFGEMQSKVQLK